MLGCLRSFRILISVFIAIKLSGEILFSETYLIATILAVSVLSPLYTLPYAPLPIHSPT